MRPAKLYKCERCGDSGYVRSASGLLEPCPNCTLGIVALAQSPCWTESPPAGPAGTAPAAVKSPPPDKRWTPAQVGRVLKIVLYVGVIAATWALNHYFGGKTPAGEILEGTETPRPVAANDFSPWEPEP